MARPARVVGRAAANFGRLARLGAARVVLPAGRFWVRVRLGSPVPEDAPPALPGSREPLLSLLQVLQLLRAASQDPRVAGVVLRLQGPPGGLARCETLARAVAELRAAGTPVVAWAESLSAEELLVASSAQRLLIPESGSVALVGLRLEGMFFRGLLENLGVAPQVVRIGDYKSAGESFTRDGLSPEHREQLEALLEDSFGVLVEGIAAGRGLEPAQVRALIDRGPFTAGKAQEAGLVDATRYPDELEDELRALSPDLADREDVPLATGPAYLALRGSDAGWTSLSRETPGLAYVVAEGTLARGRQHRGIGSEVFGGLFRRLEEDERVCAVVVRIDSGGGDVVASDLLWRALQQLRREKPVVASLGDVAASGGYYLACAADSILAESSTTTGSIGVVGGKLDLSGLYERLGIHRDGVSRGERATLFSEARAFTPGERRVVRDGMREAYGRFVSRVAEGRGLSDSEVRARAGGRVWSGAAAREQGLVDATGGPLEAIEEARRRAGIGASESARIQLLPRTPRLAALRQLVLGSGFNSSRLGL